MQRPALLILLGICFGLPLYHQLPTPWVGLAVAGGVAALVLGRAIYVEEPLTARFFAPTVKLVALLGAVAFSLSARPAAPVLSPGALATLVFYTLLSWGVILDSTKRIRRILHTLEDTHPSRCQALDEDLKMGILDEHQFNASHAYLKKELKFHRSLLTTSELVAWESLGAIVVFLIFGLVSPQDLWLNFVCAFFLSTACGMVVTRASADPVLD